MVATPKPILEKEMALPIGSNYLSYEVSEDAPLFNFISKVASSLQIECFDFHLYVSPSVEKVYRNKNEKRC